MIRKYKNSLVLCFESYGLFLSIKEEKQVWKFHTISPKLDVKFINIRKRVKFVTDIRNTRVDCQGQTQKTIIRCTFTTEIPKFNSRFGCDLVQSSHILQVFICLCRVLAVLLSFCAFRASNSAIWFSLSAKLLTFHLVDRKVD